MNPFAEEFDSAGNRDEFHDHTSQEQSGHDLLFSLGIDTLFSLMRENNFMRFLNFYFRFAELFSIAKISLCSAKMTVKWR